MLKFQRLLSVLNEADLNKIELSKFSPAEFKVYTYLFKRKKTDKITISLIAESLKLTEGTVRKTLVNLYDNLLDVFSDGNDLKKMAWMGRNYLHHDLKSFAKKYENRQRKENNLNALATFYENIIVYFMSSSYPDYDKKLMNQFIENHGLVFPFQKEMNCIMKAQHGFRMLGVMRMHSENEKIERSKREMFVTLKSELKETLLNSDDAISNWWYYYFAADYELIINQDKEKALHFADRMIACCAKGKDNIKMTSSYLINANTVKIRIAYDDNNFELVYKVIKKLMLTFSDKGGLYFWAEKLAEICIVTGRLDEAYDTYLYSFNVDLDKNWEIDKFDIYAKLALIEILKEDYSAAHEKIFFAKNNISQSGLLSISSLIKVIENAYYFIIGETLFAQDLATNNLKFCNYHKEKNTLKDFKECFKVILFCCKHQHQPKPLNIELQDIVDKWNSGDLAFAGKLINIMLEKYHEKTKVFSK